MNQQISILDEINKDEITAKITRIQEFQQFIQSALKQGHDYDTIPGTQKPSLLKPGAEKISMLLGLTTKYDIIDSTEDYEAGFFTYKIRCLLFGGDKQVAEGLGCCNSYESKYKKQDGCSIANTILKMAKKRALIDATLSFASLSEIFVAENSEIAEARKREQLENMNLTDAANLKLTFGQHKGRTLGDVYKNTYSWITWFKKNGNNELVAKAISILEEAVKAAKEVKQDSNETVVDEDGVILEEGENE